MPNQQWPWSNQRNSEFWRHSFNRDILPGEQQVPLWFPRDVHTPEGRRVHESLERDNWNASGVKTEEAPNFHSPRMHTECACLGTAEKMKKSIPLLKYPLRVLPIHSAVLGMSIQLAMEYTFTRYALDTDFGGVPISMHLESVTQVTDISFHPNYPNTPKFYSGNKITEPTTDSEFASRIIITKGVDQILYFNKAALPRINHTYKNPNIYPYGWTADITKYSCQQGLNLNSINQHQCTGIEESFIHSTIYNPCMGTAFNWYAKTIHANTNGHHLKWLASQTTIKPDDIKKCQGLTGLFHKLINLVDESSTPRKGLCITVPEQKWVDWKTMSPDSHNNFTQVTWCDKTQDEPLRVTDSVMKRGMNHRELLIGGTGNGLDYKVE